MPIDYTKSARNQSSASEREPTAAEAPTLETAVHAVLADELRVLHAWAEDETLSADERADARTRIPGIEKLDATVMEDETTWRYPMAWHEAVYEYAILMGHSVYSSAERAIDLSYRDEASARQEYERAAQYVKDHQTHS
jgi:hypothetical protein